VYAIISMTVLLAAATWAVDFGRVQLAKTQLSGGSDAAARAGAAALAVSPADAVDAAKRAAADNFVDGTVLRLLDADVELVLWDAATRTYQVKVGSDQYQANAVRVVGHRAAARSSAIPLALVKMFGRSSHDISAECVAMQVPAVNVDQGILATANPFLSGMPKGTQASLNNPHNSPDVAGNAKDMKQSPTTVGGGLPIVPGQGLTFDSIDGTAKHDPNDTSYQPDGNTGEVDHNTNGSENHILDVNAPINALVGVFLSDKAPDKVDQPVVSDPLDADCPTDFRTAAARNRTTYKPKLQQIFFIGDGQTTDGVQQKFVVPPGATRLYLATWDFYEWNNNSGQRTVKVARPQQIIVVK
ncbi:MAG: Rhs family protein, partial [Phycisphaerales bacterium]|nr:Rhs family protein [Phycisphaerales bacterium]